MEHKSSSDHPHSHKPTTSELFSSAKLVAEAAQATVNHDKSYKMDKAKVGAAADDILNAASEYGNLKEKGLGGYVDKASDYLHKYGGSDHSTTTTPDNPKVDEKKHQEGSGGFGGYMKMAEGFMTDHSTTTAPDHPTTTTTTGTKVDEKKHDQEGSGGFGGYMKMAEGFMK